MAIIENRNKLSSAADDCITIDAVLGHRNNSFYLCSVKQSDDIFKILMYNNENETIEMSLVFNDRFEAEACFDKIVDEINNLGL